MCHLWFHLVGSHVIDRWSSSVEIIVVKLLGVINSWTRSLPTAFELTVVILLLVLVWIHLVFCINYTAADGSHSTPTTTVACFTSSWCVEALVRYLGVTSRLVTWNSWNIDHVGGVHSAAVTFVVLCLCSQFRSEIVTGSWVPCSVNLT